MGRAVFFYRAECSPVPLIMRLKYFELRPSLLPQNQWHHSTALTIITQGCLQTPQHYDTHKCTCTEECDKYKVCTYLGASCCKLAHILYHSDICPTLLSSITSFCTLKDTHFCTVYWRLHTLTDIIFFFAGQEGGSHSGVA